MKQAASRPDSEALQRQKNADKNKESGRPNQNVAGRQKFNLPHGRRNHQSRITLTARARARAREGSNTGGNRNLRNRVDGRPRFPSRRNLRRELRRDRKRRDVPVVSPDEETERSGRDGGAHGDQNRENRWGEEKGIEEEEEEGGDGKFLLEWKRLKLHFGHIEKERERERELREQGETNLPRPLCFAAQPAAAAASTLLSLPSFSALFPLYNIKMSFSFLAIFYLISLKNIQGMWF